MKLSTFIRDNLDVIVKEWAVFAQTLLPLGEAMPSLALRDHAQAMLLDIAGDMETGQTIAERIAKSKHWDQPSVDAETAAAAHGALRQLEGMDISQLFGEFRALRAGVLALWRRAELATDAAPAIEEIARFNEGIDQAVAESIERYAKNIAIFMAVIGRDLRSPLGAIQGSAEMLRARPASEHDRMEVVNRIARSTERMAHVVGDLAEFSEAHLGRWVPVPVSACDIAKASVKALGTVRSIHPTQEFSMARSGDLIVKADAPGLQQALVNVLNYAAYYSDSRTPVALELAGGAESVLITVTSHGRPIAPASLQTIFEPTITTPTLDAEPHQGPYTGLGLGLFIVRAIVSRQGGSVAVQSSAETGTVFTITLLRVQDRLGTESAKGRT
jgi:signal transduction histidine kinase